MIVALRTDTKDASIWLFDGATQISVFTWQADRQLAKDLLKAIHDELQKQNCSWQDISGVAVFKGPGSFTGLRIGITVANSLAYSLEVPVVGESGDDWLANSLNRLADAKNDRIVLPFYGADAHITVPRK